MYHAKEYTASIAIDQDVMWYMRLLLTAEYIGFNAGNGALWNFMWLWSEDLLHLSAEGAPSIAAKEDQTSGKHQTVSRAEWAFSRG